MEEVEEENILDYRLRLFTIFNDVALLGDMMGIHQKQMFRYRTDDENHNEFLEQVEIFKKQGLL